MRRFNSKYFQKVTFSREEINAFQENALRDLDIARKDKFAIVTFTYAYQALIKRGITLLAEKGYRVRSVPGHHIQILAKMAGILGRKDIREVGNAMRMKRNLDFYSGGEFVSQSEAKSYLQFVENVFELKS